MVIGGVATVGAVRTWPFRVYSFPSNIQMATYQTCLSITNGRVFFRGQKIRIYSGDLRSIKADEVILESIKGNTLYFRETLPFVESGDVILVGESNEQGLGCLDIVK